MAIGDDFEIQGDGDIRAVAGTANYTVLELHRWLQDLADDAQASSDDFMDITVSTPSERATDNIITLNPPFNIDDLTAQRLYDGSITQKNGDEIYAGLVCVGAVEPGTQLQIWQDEGILTSHWGTGKNADPSANILNRVLVKVRTNGADIDGRRIIVYARELSDTYAEFSLTMTTGNNVAAIFTSNDLNNQTPAATIATWTDITNTEGYQTYDITGDGLNEPYYSRWDYGSRTSSQVYERTKWLTRRGTTSNMYGFTTAEKFRGITHQFDYDGELTSPSENAIIVWGTSFDYNNGTGTVPAVGQYWRNTTVGGVGKVVFVSSGAGATGTVVIQRESATPAWSTGHSYTLLGGTGTFQQNGAATPPASSTLGGAARLLAKLDSGTTGTLWVQLISGTICGDNDAIWQRGGTTGKYVDVNGAATARTIKPEFIGVYTGSAFIGAFGIGVNPANGTASDQFFDLTNTLRQPPNNQTFTVFGLVAGEDRVLVAPESGGGINFSQFTLDNTYNTAGVTSIQVSPNIPSDTPPTGVIRIQLNSGIYRRVPYTSYSGDVFTIPSTDFSGANAANLGNNTFIGYIDKLAASASESYTAVFSSSRPLFVRVRDGGATPIKTFETTATFGPGGGSATAIRTSDT